MHEPICLDHIKPSFPRDRHGSINVCSTLDFLLYPRIVLELSKQRGKLLLGQGLDSNAAAILSYLQDKSVVKQAQTK